MADALSDDALADIRRRFDAGRETWRDVNALLLEVDRLRAREQVSRRVIAACGVRSQMLAADFLDAMQACLDGDEDAAQAAIDRGLRRMRGENHNKFLDNARLWCRIDMVRKRHHKLETTDGD